MAVESAQRTEVFRKSDLFEGVSGECLRRICSASVQLMVPRYEMVYRTDDPPDAFYVLEQGLVCVAVPIRDSRNVVVALQGPGRAFGWSALVSDVPRVESTLALADSLVWKVPVRVLQDVAGSEAACSAALYRNISNITLRLLYSSLGHFKGEHRRPEHLERCPALVEGGLFYWRLDGALIEAKCAGRPRCGVPETSCPIVQGPPSQWANLMLSKYSSLVRQGERALHPALSCVPESSPALATTSPG